MHFCTVTDAYAAQSLPYMGATREPAKFSYLSPLSTGLNFSPPTITPPEGQRPIRLEAEDYAAPGLSLYLDYAALQSTLEQPFTRLRLFWLNTALGFDFGDRFVIVGEKGVIATYTADRIRPAAALLSLCQRPDAVVTACGLQFRVLLPDGLSASYHRASLPRVDVDGALFVSLTTRNGETRHYVALDDRDTKGKPHDD